MYFAKKGPNRNSDLLITASWLLYIACLFLDGYIVNYQREVASAGAGWVLLLVGWLGVIDTKFTWFANPLMFVAWYLAQKGQFKAASWLAGLALALIAQFLTYKRIIASEAPTYAAIVGVGAGYWLWFASAASLLLGSILGTSQERNVASQQ